MSNRIRTEIIGVGRAILTLCCILVANSVCGQQPFSRLLDLEHGNGNYPVDLIEYNSHLIVGAGHICLYDTTNCFSISRLNWNGQLMDSEMVLDFYAGSDNAMFLFTDSIIVSSNKLNIDSTNLSFVLGSVSSMNFGTKQTRLSDILLINNGIVQIDQTRLVTYGSELIESTDSVRANIIFWDDQLDSIEYSRSFDPDTIGVAAYDLHDMDSGELLFASRTHSGGARNDYRIVRLEADDDIVILYEFSDINDRAPCLLVDSSGYYISSQNHPEESFPLSFGRLNKIESNSCTLEWSYELPTDPFSNQRKYQINDMIQVSNGDLVLCGAVQTVENKELMNAGFMARLSSYGILAWIRIFTPENLVVPEILGNARPSALTKLIKFQNGFAAIGYSVQLYKDGQSELDLWILHTDDSGCLSNDNCDEVNVIASLQLPRTMDKSLIYPNPVTSTLYFDLMGRIEYTLWNIQGRLIDSGVCTSKLNVGDLAPGVYILKYSTDRNSGFHKFVKN